MRTVILFLVVFALSSCDMGGESEVVKLPLYKSCVDKVSDYAEEMKKRFSGTGQKINITLSYFDFTSKVHEGIVGLIEIEGVGVKNFELDVNTVKGMCFPETVANIGRDELGLRVIDNQISENNSKGIKTYFEITEDKYILYYNDRKKLSYLSGTTTR